MTKILGIETSCDETAAAVVENGRYIRSNIVVSSLREHQKFGGIIPEIASRRQLECINAVVDEALRKARADLSHIQAIAVTTHPGLIGSLLVGTSFANALGFALNKPVINVNHLHAHLYANFLTANKTSGSRAPQLPAIGLVASGGHTQLYHVKSPSSYRLLGQTLDDAAGEAFDKVARILGLGYPGGPAIDKIARNTKANARLRFSPAELPGSFNFSFSGTKTAVLYHTQKLKKMTAAEKAQTVHAFQKSVISILVKKSLTACKKYKTRALMIGGGVAANSELRQQLSDAAQNEKIRVYYPPMNLCVDNAAMIAGLAHYLRKK